MCPKFRYCLDSKQDKALTNEWDVLLKVLPHIVCKVVRLRHYIRGRLQLLPGSMCTCSKLLPSAKADTYEQTAYNTRTLYLLSHALHSPGCGHWQQQAYRSPSCTMLVVCFGYPFYGLIPWRYLL